MIKISSWVSGTFLIVWFLYWGISSATAKIPLTSEAWGGISIAAAGIAIGLFVLTYLGVHVIRKHKGAIRLGVLISVLWVIGFFVELEPYKRFGSWADFVVIGVVPVISYLGILWVISGFLPKKKIDEDS